MNKRNMKSFVFLIFKTSIFEHKVYVEILRDVKYGIYITTNDSHLQVMQ